MQMKQCILTSKISGRSASTVAFQSYSIGSWQLTAGRENLRVAFQTSVTHDCAKSESRSKSSKDLISQRSITRCFYGKPVRCINNNCYCFCWGSFDDFLEVHQQQGSLQKQDDETSHRKLQGSLWWPVNLWWSHRLLRPYSRREWWYGKSYIRREFPRLTKLLASCPRSIGDLELLQIKKNWFELFTTS